MTIAQVTPKMNITRESNGKQSLSRVIAFWGMVITSGAFGCAAYKGKISAEMFLTFPLGLTILYAPQLAIKLLQIWKGQEGDQ